MRGGGIVPKEPANSHQLALESKVLPHNPSVTFGDSSLYTREPLLTLKAYAIKGGDTNAEWIL